MRRPLAVLASVAGLAAWLDFSRLQQLHHADSLLPVLTGLTRWTPFYWGQDRFGMLIPFLALPVRDPEMHLLVQGFLTLALSVWGLILLVRALLPRSLPWVPAAALLVVLLLLLPPAEELRFNILWAQPYMVSFALGLTGAALVHRGGRLRLAAALLLFLVAAWVNVSVVAVIVPLVLWRAVFTDAGRLGLTRLRFALYCLVFIALATYASAQISRAVSLPHTPTAIAPPMAWARAASALLLSASGYEKVRLWVGVAFGLAALGILGILATPRWRAAGATVTAACGLLATATVPFAIAVSSSWVAQNDYSVRYLIPSLVLLEAALCLLATLPGLVLPSDKQRVLSWASVGAVMVALLWSVGPPSREAVKHAFDSRWGTATREVIAARATHVTGDYWKVWPTVFYATWLLGTPSRESWPFGISDRSIATLDQSRMVTHPRVAVLDGQGRWLSLLGPRRWLVAERRSTCLILVSP